MDGREDAMGTTTGFEEAMIMLAMASASSGFQLLIKIKRIGSGFDFCSKLKKIFFVWSLLETAYLVLQPHNLMWLWLWLWLWWTTRGFVCISMDPEGHITGLLQTTEIQTTN